MSEDIRKMIDKVKNFKQFVNEQKLNEMDIYDGLGGVYRGYKWEVLHDGKDSWIVINDKKIMLAKEDKLKNEIAVEKYINELIKSKDNF